MSADSGHARAFDLVTAMLGESGRVLVVILEDELLEIELTDAGGLGDFQVGYAIATDGTSLVGPDGSWRSGWLAIGAEVLLGDPVFVDLDDPVLPVFVAEHGLGAWRPVPLADSLEGLLSG